MTSSVFLCVYVHMYLCVYFYKFVFIFVYICVYTRLYVLVCVFICLISLLSVVSFFHTSQYMKINEEHSQLRPVLIRCCELELNSSRSATKRSTTNFEELKIH